MFEKMIGRVRDAAEAKARAHATRLAGRAADELPRGIAAQAEADGVRLTGRGLRRRMALEPALRSLFQRLP